MGEKAVVTIQLFFIEHKGSIMKYKDKELFKSLESRGDHL